MEIFVSDFRELLNLEFQKRCKKNSRYSLRAFAKSLDFEPSHLSKILSKKRKLSFDNFIKLAHKMKLNESELEKFKFGLFGNKVETALELETPEYNQLEEDTFNIISDWYHYAILELTKINNFKPNVEWIARKLGISKSEVLIAKKRLLNVGLLQIQNDGNWVDLSGAITTIQNTYTNSAYKNLQKQILSKAINAVNEIPFQKRTQSSMTMAIDSNLIEDAKALTTEYRRNLCKLLKSSEKRDSVYHLSISLYPVTLDLLSENEDFENKEDVK